MGSDSEKVTIFFVQQPQTSALLGVAHKAVSGYQNITSAPIEERDVAASHREKQPRTYFVLSTFTGPAFTHLRGLGCPVLGPHVILHYLRENAALPAWPLPLFSAAMQRAVVSFTAISGEKRQRLIEMVRMMHGEVTGDFTSSVNVIVSPKVGSKKYLVGNQVGVPVLLPGWIEEAWRLSEFQDPFDAMAKSYLLKFRVPVFHNLVISVSGLSADDREEASRLIEANGGRYSGDLKVGECSHLVINKPVGEKFHYARRWKVQIVTSNWLFDSLERGYALEEANYKLPVGTEAPPQGSSTPEEQSGKRRKLPPPPDVSVISHPNCTHIGESRMMGNDTIASNIHSDSSITPKNVSDPLESQPLSGCLVAALGRVSCREEIARQLAELGGRLCDSGVAALSEDVSHILVPDPASLRPEHLQFEAGLPVVTLQWLTDCHERRCRLPERDYAVQVPARLQEGDGKENAVTSRELEEEHGVTSRERKMDTMTSREEDAEAPAKIDADEMAMINQYFEACDTESEVPAAENSAMVLSNSSAAASNDCSAMSLGNSTVAALSATVLPDEVPSPAPKSKVFAGARFFFHPSANLAISAAFSQRLRSLLKENGVASLSSPLTSADYCVAHFFGTALPPCRARPGPRLVTLAWVYACLESGRLLDEGGQMVEQLVRPMAAHSSEDHMVLKGLFEGCVLCVSGFQGALRTCLCLFAEALGARMQEGLMRKALPKRGIAASTHLVCAKPSGDKFAAARRWNIPVVSKAWLFASAKSRSLLPCEEFPVTPEKNTSPSDPKDSVSLNSSSLGGHSFRTPTAPAPRRAVNNAPAPAESPRAGMDTPGKFLKEDFVPEFDMAEIADMLRTPEGCGRKVETPLTEKVDKGLSNALRLSKMQSPSSVPVPVEKTRGPLWHVVIYVAKKLSGRQIELNSQVQAAGGQYKWRYDPRQVTHVIFEGAPSDYQQREEVRLARRDKKFVVHPAWVLACAEKGERLSEDAFPPEIRPNMRLEMTSASQEIPEMCSHEDPSSLSRIDLQPAADSVSTVPPMETGLEEGMDVEAERTVGPDEMEDTNPVEESSPRCEILENLDQHLESSSIVGKRRRRRRSESLPEARPGPQASGQGGSEEGSEEDQVHPSQSLQVHWRYDDSDGHTLSAGHHLASPAPSTRPSISPPIARLFVLSGFPEADRSRLAAIISRQGAQLQESREVSDLGSVTHLVVAKPTRGEKFMTCAAAGKWVLHRSFLEAAAASGSWPPEERFEWGAPGTEPILAAQSALERSLARAARRWRQQGGGAFSGWRAVFCSGVEGAGSRLDSFARILRAGGAEVLAEGPPFPAPAGVTHAFVETRKGSVVEPSQLPAGFCWLKHEFLSAFLTDERAPDPKDFVLADRSQAEAKPRARGGKRPQEEDDAANGTRVTRASKRLRRK